MARSSSVIGRIQNTDKQGPPFSLFIPLATRGRPLQRGSRAIMLVFAIGFGFYLTVPSPDHHEWCPVGGVGETAPLAISVCIERRRASKSNNESLGCATPFNCHGFPAIVASAAILAREQYESHGHNKWKPL